VSITVGVVTVADEVERGENLRVYEDPPAARPDELVSAPEIADMLGWPRTKVWSYYVKGISGFPPAWGGWPSNRLWLRADIEAWAEQERDRHLKAAEALAAVNKRGRAARRR